MAGDCSPGAMLAASLTQQIKPLPLSCSCARTSYPQVFEALLAGRVPSAWLAAYPSLKPLGAWARDLLARLEQLADWASGSYPAVYWLGGFTYPTGFLTAVLQTAARRSGLAIDGLGFDYSVVRGAGVGWGRGIEGCAYKLVVSCWAPQCHEFPPLPLPLTPPPPR